MATVAFARTLGRVRPVYLVTIALQGAGAPVLYLSDRNVTAAGHAYEDYIASVSAPAEEVRRPTGDALNAPLRIEFKNDPWRAYARLIEAGADYAFEGSRCTLGEAYIDDAGALSEPSAVFVGTLDAPSEIDLMQFVCTVSAIDYLADSK